MFYESKFIIQYTLGDTIKLIILVNIFVTRFGLIDKKFIEIFYKKLKIQFYYLIKSKLIQEFNSRSTWFNIFTIYLMLFEKDYINSLAFLFITKLW